MKKEKISQIPDVLNELDIDLWLIIEKESGVLSDPVSDLIIGADATWLSFYFFFRSGKKLAIVGNLDIEKFRRLELFEEIFTYKSSPKEDLLKILQENNPSKIALDYSTNSPASDGLTYGRYLQLVKLLEETDFSSRFMSAEDIISKLRGRKSEEEVDRIQHAVDITLSLYDKVAEFAKPGQTEKDIAQFLIDERKKLGLLPSWEEEHNPAVFAGPQETGAHSGPTGNKLQRGHVFNIDFGVKYRDYCSDLQRTWYILREDETEPPEEVIKGFNTIKESIKLSFDAIRPGVTGVEIDTICRDYIVSQGYEEFPHALGHQVGRSAHDGGALLGPTWERYGNLPLTPLEEGQVFTIEPRLYLKEHGVVTIEEMIVITADGARWLSKPQEEIYLVK
jgi:Xaa-Pro aminopeptidase